MMPNARTVTLKLKRSQVCRLLLATTLIKQAKTAEMSDPSVTDDRRSILEYSAQMWQALHEELRQQLDGFDTAHGI